ncbi:hypothetical protein OHA98_42535 [Streptomyces sp. NBC_00654]|uniref:hypothetical protein n=1 Tax=Streptomyces sp. NBC_00654 TaxID=2975799 RepID=UPI00225079DE|nr:hypothetical protein [Streptomyces sp. NBC_00654]MCX4971276.1 hypothetical protein [Streptomyces sp. NBC_00654]
MINWLRVVQTGAPASARFQLFAWTGTVWAGSASHFPTFSSSSAERVRVVGPCRVTLGSSASRPRYRINEFLNAVGELRGEDETVRATAHTSSISAEGWTTTEAAEPAMGSHA